MRLFRHTTAAALAVVGALGLVAVPAAANEPTEPDLVAWFEGRQIRLADGWGEARACMSDLQTTHCYRTEAEMDAAHPDEGRAERGAVLLATCSPALKLYRGTSYTGNVLELSTRFVTISLAPYGFDNDTSSYKIGGCNSRLYDTTTGGSAYPGNTNAGVWAPSMLSGWDNRVGSVYIN